MAEQIKKANNEVAVKTKNEVSYQLSNGNTMVLNNEIIRKLTNDNKNITDDEVFLFIEMCKAQKLNPLNREAYIIKFDGSKPSQQVVSLSAFMRIADEHPKYEGIEDGIIVKTTKGDIVDREGCVTYPNEMLIGGWAKVYRSDRKIPTKIRLDLKEYTKGQATWNNMKCTMINKCAKVAALRKAFPSAFNGMYIEDEYAIDKEEVKTNAKNNVEEVIYDIIDSNDTANETVVQDVIMQENVTTQTAESAEGENQENEQQEFFEGKPIIEIPYAEYQNNKEKFEKANVEGIKAYNGETKMIRVIEK